MPWKEHFYELEAELFASVNPPLPSQQILYVLYPESSEKPEGKWRIQCVPVRSEGFKNRKDIVDA